MAPTALVDLGKPAFKLGVAEIRVGTRGAPDRRERHGRQAQYAVRGTAKVTITGKLPDGKPAAGAEVAFAAVDEALLELMPNTSWDLLDAMMQRRSWGVETSTAQMEIIGRRHYGRKAVPAGGGGGRGGTRELFDTLLLWNAAVVLDANGEAVVDVPLNDALTSFRLVAVADAGAGLFGSGQTTIQITQDLQLISGLPPLVREGDLFRALFTLRNTTTQAMKVARGAARDAARSCPPQNVEIPAGEAREVAWTVTAPAQLAFTRSIPAVGDRGERQRQRRARRAQGAATPDPRRAGARAAGHAGAARRPVHPARGAAGRRAGHDGAIRGGLKLALQPKLGRGLPGVRDWFDTYPFTCLEQKTSKAIGLRDGKLWQGVAAQMPTYLDADGLASYFPPREGDGARGSDLLTAYLLAATHEAASLNPAFALSDEVRAPMERGLTAFVEGRIERNFWSPQTDLDVRKLAAIEALSRYGKAQGRMLGSLTIAPNQWPTSAVIDWVNILQARARRSATRAAPGRGHARSCKSRLSWRHHAEVQHRAERLLVVADGQRRRQHRAPGAGRDRRPGLEGRDGRLVIGCLARQQRGAWPTTTANLWGVLALERFSARFEATPVAGVTRAALAAATASVDWAKVERIKTTEPAARRTRPRVRRPGLARHPARQHDVAALGQDAGAGDPQRHAPGRRASPGSRCRRWPPSR